MGSAVLQRDIRSAISITYELLRHEQILQQVRTASTLRDLESELARIEAKLGGPRCAEIAPASLDPWLSRVETAAGGADPVVAGQIRALVESLRDIQRDLAEMSARAPGSLSRRAPALVAGLGALASVSLSRTSRAKGVGRVIGSTAMALATLKIRRGGRDVKGTLQRAAGGALGAALAAAPFAVGYAKKDPSATRLQVWAGLAAVGIALWAGRARASR